MLKVDQIGMKVNGRMVRMGIMRMRREEEEEETKGVALLYDRNPSVQRSFLCYH
jgi:hypothetical protein